MNKNKNIKIIKNNIEKIRPMNKSKNKKKLEMIVILLMSKTNNIKIIKNNIEKIRPMNKNKK